MVRSDSSLEDGSANGGAQAMDSSPKCSLRHLLDCQFTEWYPKFSGPRPGCSRPRLTPRSVVLPLCEEIVAYLSADDGIVLPANFELSCAKGNNRAAVDDDWSSEEGADDENASDDSNQPAPAPSGPAFDALAVNMAQAIAELGGRVFPKLNWSCPKDAAWMNGGSLCCRTPGDVLCLLKSSHFITHDLLHSHAACHDANSTTRPQVFTLVLRRWCEFAPSRQFRCFVRNRSLIGISQRDCSARYPHLQADKERLARQISDFFLDHVREVFPDPDFVMDVYVDRKDVVWLIDFNVFAAVTDSLLFSWEELAAASSAVANPCNSQQRNGVIGALSNPAATVEAPLPDAAAAASDAGSGTLSFSSTSSTDGAECSGTEAERLEETSAEEAEVEDSSANSRNNSVDVEIFRIVTEDLELCAGPMARYRGPEDAELLAHSSGAPAGTDGAMDFKALLDRCGGLAM